jgi:O-antigen ligase
MIQELGTVGMAVLAGLILWIAITLYQDIRSNPTSEATELRYALLLFSLGWPLWLWYTKAWNHSVAMLLYWLSLGYVLGEARREQVVTEEARLSRLSIQSMTR